MTICLFLLELSEPGVLAALALFMAIAVSVAPSDWAHGREVPRP